MFVVKQVPLIHAHKMRDVGLPPKMMEEKERKRVRDTGSVFLS